MTVHSLVKYHVNCYELSLTTYAIFSIECYFIHCSRFFNLCIKSNCWLLSGENISPRGRSESKLHCISTEYLRDRNPSGIVQIANDIMLSSLMAYKIVNLLQECRIVQQLLRSRVVCLNGFEYCLRSQCH
jgi:hypothetical protein